MNRIPVCLVMILAAVLGVGSLVLFAAFVFFGPVASVRLDITEGGVLYGEALLSLLFVTQHILMVRTRPSCGRLDSSIWRARRSQSISMPTGRGPEDVPEGLRDFILGSRCLLTSCGEA